MTSSLRFATQEVKNQAGCGSRALGLLGLWSIVLLSTLWVLNLGTAATVRIRLETTDLNSNVVSSINVGEQFLLRGYVTDLRPNAEGVFASFLDVECSPAASVVVTGAITFIAPFTLFPSASPTNTGSIYHLGSVSSSFTGNGGGEKPHFNVPFRANAPGAVTFTGHPSAGAEYYVLLFGIDDAIPAEQIEFVNTSLMVNSMLRISRIEVRTNGAFLTISGPQNTTVQVQSVTNLTNPAWQNLGGSLLIGTDGTAGFWDSDATNRPTRFYRAYQP